MLGFLKRLLLVFRCRDFGKSFVHNATCLKSSMTHLLYWLIDWLILIYRDPSPFCGNKLTSVTPDPNLFFDAHVSISFVSCYCQCHFHFHVHFHVHFNCRSYDRFIHFLYLCLRIFATVSNLCLFIRFVPVPVVPVPDSSPSSTLLLLCLSVIVIFVFITGSANGRVRR